MKNNTVPITTNDAARSARNRANAAHSTGPKTEAGKKRSSLNAYRHGLTGQTIILPKEDLDAYQAFTRTFFNDYKPVGTLEKTLVQFLADTSWRLNRVAALEHNLMGLGFNEHSNSISTEHPEAHAALVTTKAMREEIPSLAVLGLHTARLSRHFKENLKQLNDAQEKRRATEAQQLSEAAALLQMDRKQGLPYNPPKMASFFQIPKSRPSSAAGTASKQPPHDVAHALGVPRSQSCERQIDFGDAPATPASPGPIQ